MGTFHDAATATRGAHDDMLDDAAAVALAFSAFYVSLTTAQRTIVDEFFGHGPFSGPRSGPFG